MSQRYRSVPRGFTLVEMLVVMGIVVILTSMTLGGLRRAIVNAERARAQAQLEAIKAALAMYESDLRLLPRSQQGASDAELLADHGPYLYAALQNKPAPTLGGGPRAPYVRGTEIGVGAVTDRAVLAAEPMGKDGETRVRPLETGEQGRLSLAEFQRAHAPEGAEPLVFLDPWGGPWHCRIWKDVDHGRKSALMTRPVPREGFGESAHGQAAVAGPVLDGPHDPVGVDLWSNGPNGINEYGGGDDVRSW